MNELDSLKDLVRQFFSILNRVNVTDEGTEVHPTVLICTDTLDSIKLNTILIQLDDLVNLKQD